MQRRRFLVGCGLATGIACAGCLDALEGAEPDIEETVRSESEITFTAEPGDTITISVDTKAEISGFTYVTFRTPAGGTLYDNHVSSGGPLRETFTAEHDGTYQLLIHTDERETHAEVAVTIDTDEE